MSCFVYSYDYYDIGYLVMIMYDRTPTVKRRLPTHVNTMHNNNHNDKNNNNNKDKNDNNSN